MNDEFEEWEVISKEDNGSGGIETARMWTPGGWIVRVITDKKYVALVVVQDHGRHWGTIDNETPTK